jgi:hypothetical protein
MHNGPISPVNRRRHDVKLLNKGEYRGNKHVESENTPMCVHPVDGRTKTPSTIRSLFCWGGEDVLNLNLPTKQNTQVLVRVSELDQWPAGILDARGGRGEEA